MGRTSARIARLLRRRGQVWGTQRWPAQDRPSLWGVTVLLMWGLDLGALGSGETPRSSNHFAKSQKVLEE